MARGGGGGEELWEARRMLEVTKRRVKKVRGTIDCRAANPGNPTTIPGQFSQCPKLTNSTPVLLLGGLDAYGQSGSNLIELLHALQYN